MTARSASNVLVHLVYSKYSEHTAFVVFYFILFYYKIILLLVLQIGKQPYQDRFGANFSARMAAFNASSSRIAKSAVLKY